MRFKKVVFQEYKRLADEQRHLDFHRDKDRLAGKERLPFWGEMEFEEFNRLFNTLSWLQKFNAPHSNLGERVVVKPTTADIIEVARRIGEDGADLRLHAQQHQPGELKNDLQKTAIQEIKCGKHYEELAKSGFFDDKRIDFR